MSSKRRVTFLVSTRDRSSELVLLLQSLRTQTWKEWDLVVVDGSSPKPVLSMPFVSSLVNRIKLEGHKVAYVGVSVPGVCFSRQTCIEVAEREGFEGMYYCRVDDDTVLEADYLERLMLAVGGGWDLVSGLTVHCGGPSFVRESRFVKPVINRIVASDKGDVLRLGDDCAFLYDSKEVLPAHHFRSCALYTKDLHWKSGIDYKLPLSLKGFREEAFISLRALLAGYKLGVDLGAVNWHLQAGSGGCRFGQDAEMVQQDEYRFRSWFKQQWERYGDFLRAYDGKVVK